MAKKQVIQKQEKKSAGRPSKYTQEIADLICEQIATTTKSLKNICKDERFPSTTTILNWLREDINGFLLQYTRAKEQQADMMADEIIEISDNSENDLLTGGVNVQRDRLRIDARKWVAAKLKPKAYGDKLDVTSKGEQIGLVSAISEEAKAKVNEILDNEY
jgi:hypothetical protein